ncbi:hypothetical protein EG68_03868 [Paragonimus skrjabini miyazakii]|uniref:Uncharacterized protein n=1 Tax=Paragonimus skrjabini miyazakii TaxID=59628 RepID=A0A8S9YW69_9TREM|nr:hypothetical protein EG68_03868 [Paragonimus skrjabini miyazakii]
MTETISESQLTEELGTTSLESDAQYKPSTPEHSVVGAGSTPRARKSQRPRKLPAFLEDDQVNHSENPKLSTKDLGECIPFVKEQQAVDIDNERRKSLRPRRKVTRCESFQDEEELDQLLSDEMNLQAYGPAQHWDTGAGDYISDDWVSVEKLLAHRVLEARKRTKFISEAVKSYPAIQRKMVELEYFVKFHNQSYWHCAWMSGAILLALHPNMVRNYFRVNQFDVTEDEPAEAVESVDTSSNCSASVDSSAKSSTEEPRESVAILTVSDPSGPADAPAPTQYQEPGCSKPEEDEKTNSPTLTIAHSSQDEDDDEDELDQWSEECKENVARWVTPDLMGAGARRRYLVRWGVENQCLIAERIISIGDKVDVLNRDANVTCEDPVVDTVDNPLCSVDYREVLVKWFNVPASQATWETIEADMDMFTIVSSAPKNVRTSVRDASGRKLLPFLVRRHLIRLTQAYCTRIARMLCDAYGSHNTFDKRPPPGNFDWKTMWTNGQPSYISPIQHATLYPYQLEGVRWLWNAYHNHVNAILADEMGLGKTVQVIALLCSLWKERNDYGPFLIVAPLSTLQNWEREFEVWAPEFHVLVYSGDRNVRAALQEYEFRIPNSGGVAAFHVLITSHELACIERSCLQGFEWSALVVDEAHRLKNKQSRLFKETSQYKAGFKMLLTGTPLQNNLEELFHLLYFVEPKAVTTFKSLTEKWAEMSKEERISSLHDQLKNHLLRRLKADVISDLPKKSEITVLVEMSVLQRKLYKLILTKNYEELRCGSLMNSLVHLQKVCDHPYLIPAGDAIAPRLNVDQPNPRYEPKALVQVSGKLVVLMKLLRGLRSGGHRVLIYSRMTTMLDILEEALANEEYAYERIDGRVKGPVRQIIIDRFNSKLCEAFIFLLSTRAGGEGINLASADTVILYDSDWNPQCDLQALSRAHRIGQSRHVVVYRFVTRHSMEERVSLVARRKLALTDLVVNQRQQRIQWKSLNVQPLEPGTSDASAEVTPGGVEPSEEQADTGETSEPLLKATRKCDQTLKGSVSNRLSRAEMDDLLRCGLEALFAVDDPLDEKDLQKAVAVTDGDDENTENSERLVYDDEAIARLLDRSSLESTSDAPKSGIDDYLCTFRVAHFDPITKAETTSVNQAPGVEAESAEEHKVQEQPTETLGYAAFWDKLLRERYQRLCAVEAETTSSNSRRVSKASWRLQQQTSYNSSSSSSSRDSDQESSCWIDHTDSEGTHTNSTDKPHAPARSKPSYRSKQAGSMGYRTLDICKRVKSSRKHPQSNPNGQPDSANERSKSLSFKNTRARRKSEEQKHKGKLSHDESLPGLGEDSTDLHLESDEDPTYVPSGDEDSDEILSNAQLLGKWRKREKNNCDNGTSSASPSSEDLGHLLSETTMTDLGNICTETCKTAFWHPVPAVLAKWREVANKMGPKITWEYGHMFIYGFGPDDRQSFANAVMRYGLPPPGIVPPQDWLPPNLYYKSPPRVFAYMTLFMQHLYDDPNAIDDSVDSWSDGLPKEKLCGSAVLARIAMMTLIRNKVMQFEDVNGVHSRTFEAVSTRFKFSINEGGLTLLRPTWYDEWQRINAKVEDVMPQSRVWNVATKKREEVMHHLQYTWHSRHDYWLLAGIHVHGYMRWADILADPRFHLLNTGLEGLLMDNEKKNGNSRWADLNSSHVNMAEAQAFLVTRLRLLEQALVVEQALYEVAKAALTGNADGNQPQLIRVQSLAVCLSNKLASAGPRKRIALPRDIVAREATRAAVANLQEILEDIYADLPCLPASVICAEPETPAVSSTCDPPLNTPISSTSDSEERPIIVERQSTVEDLPSRPNTAAATPTSAAMAGESIQSALSSGDLPSSTSRSPVHSKLSPPSPNDVDNNNKAVIEISDDDT